MINLDLSLDLSCPLCKDKLKVVLYDTNNFVCYPCKSIFRTSLLKISEIQIKINNMYYIIDFDSNIIVGFERNSPAVFNYIPDFNSYEELKTIISTLELFS
jgi:hypothetical protein